MAWLTPDAETGMVYRLIAIPSPFLYAVNGALTSLEFEHNWEASGNMTVAECAAAMSEMITAYFGGGYMLGAVIPYAGSTANLPGHLLLCDGAVYNRVDYPALYAVLAAAYIDDADTFHTPNLVEKFIMGTDENAGTTGGEATHTLTVDEIPSHAHTYQPPEFNLDMEGPEIPDIGATILALPSLTGYTGGGQSHNNLPPHHDITYVMVAQ